MLNMTRQLIISLLCLGFCLGLSATQATATTSHLQVRVVNPEGLKPTKPVDPPKHMSSIPQKLVFISQVMTCYPKPACPPLLFGKLLVSCA